MYLLLERRKTKKEQLPFYESQKKKAMVILCFEKNNIITEE